jgi:MarR family 2-MHQ and catechol resistance regulon transcriptional repressor
MKREVASYGVRADRTMATWIQLSRLFSKVSSKEIAYFKAHDLTLHQFKVLEVLYHRGSLSVGAITKLTMSTAGNITVVVRNLKRDGWIEAICDPTDRRSTSLKILPKGKEVIERIFPQHAKNLQESFEILSDEELETLFGLLRRVEKTS